jgi:hypothetical protein
MARTHDVKARRVGKKGAYELRCNYCGQPIEIGQPYKYFTMKMSYGGVKKSYHAHCKIPPSHRTTSRLGEIWDAQAALDFSECNTEEDCQGVLNDLAETVRSVAEEYSDSVSSMEEGFGHSTYQSEELQERVELLEGWADQLESFQSSESEPSSEEDDEDEESVSEWETFREGLREEAQSLADECPC